MIPFVIIFFIWAGLHSLMAAQFFKDRVCTFLGEEKYRRTYRFFYNSFAILSFIPVLYFYWLLPDFIMWQVSAPWSAILISLQILGIVGTAVSVWQTGPFSFLGLSQLFNSNPEQHTTGLGETLYISGLYRWMRHPLYTFSMVLLWCFPTMTRDLLLFNLLVSAYFIFGSILEERRLTADFGSAYTDYQATVPRFIPFLKWSLKK